MATDAKSVIFLDVDGVLNNTNFWVTREKCPRAEWDQHRENGFNGVEPRCFVDPVNVAVLNDLLDKSGALVVVSSTWRLPTVGQNRRLLHRMGVKKARQRCIGSTPALAGYTPEGVYQGTTRGREIQAWLEQHGAEWNVSRFVILDDDADMGDLLPWLVQTDYATGLTAADVARALDVLRASPDSPSHYTP